MSEKYVFLFGDADQVRRKVENYLFDNNLQELQKFSADLTYAIQEIAFIAKDQLNAQVIIAGGDDILLKVLFDDYNEDMVIEIMKIFNKITNNTISFGVGISLEDAFVNLAKAKAEGFGSLKISKYVLS